MVVSKNSKGIKIVVLLIVLGLTIVEVFSNKVTIFYIIYLFWFDEFFKSLFNFIAVKRLDKNHSLRDKMLSEVKLRFSFLGGYWLFIVVFFGIIFAFDNFQNFGFNVMAFTFKNIYFNLSVFTFLLRELVLLRSKNAILEENISMLSNGIIILHLSIIFGVLLYFISLEKLNIEPHYLNLIAIAPFLLLKLLFEVQA